MANFLCSSTAAWFTMRRLSRIRILAFSIVPERVTGICNRTPGVAREATAASALSARARATSTGTTTAGTGGGDCWGAP
jgi:hypothetical protein